MIIGSPSPFGRPIVYGGARECPHRRRVLGAFIFSNGARHICDWCLVCGARGDAISRIDLIDVDIDPARIPVVRDHRGRAAVA
jgi:hypothetical protein